MTKQTTKLEPMEVEIDGERYEVDRVTPHGRGFRLECGRVEFAVFEDSDDAGEDAREYWQSMAENDPREFECMVGAETLVAWALGRYAGPGSTQVRSLEEWLDLTSGVPEEHHASYDGEEKTLDAVGDEIADETTFRSGVAYRMN